MNVNGGRERVLLLLFLMSLFNHFERGGLGERKRNAPPLLNPKAGCGITRERDLRVANIELRLSLCSFT